MDALMESPAFMLVGTFTMLCGAAIIVLGIGIASKKFTVKQIRFAVATFTCWAISNFLVYGAVFYIWLVAYNEKCWRNPADEAGYWDLRLIPVIILVQVLANGLMFSIIEMSRHVQKNTAAPETEVSK